MAIESYVGVPGVAVDIESEGDVAEAREAQLVSLLNRALLNIDFGWNACSLKEIKERHGNAAAWLVKDAREALGKDGE